MFRVHFCLRGVLAWLAIFRFLYILKICCNCSLFFLKYLYMMGHSHLNILMWWLKLKQTKCLAWDSLFLFLLYSLLSFAAEKPDNNTVVYYILISIAVTFTLVELFCLYRKVPAIREKCCSSSVNVEKEDENPDYGEYHYYLFVLWVCFWFYTSHTQILRRYNAV